MCIYFCGLSGTGTIVHIIIIYVWNVCYCVWHAAAAAPPPPNYKKPSKASSLVPILPNYPAELIKAMTIYIA